MEALRKVIRIRENLENQKKQCTFAVFKKTKVLTVPCGTLKTKDYGYKKNCKRTLRRSLRNEQRRHNYDN